MAHLLRAPGQLGLGRAYAAGEFEADDLDRVIGLLDRFHAPRSLAHPLRLTLAAVRAYGLTRPPRSPPSELARAATPQPGARRTRGAPPLRRLQRLLRAVLDSSMT